MAHLLFGMNSWRGGESPRTVRRRSAVRTIVATLLSLCLGTATLAGMGGVPEASPAEADPVVAVGDGTPAEVLADLRAPSLASLLWSTTLTLRASGGYHDNPRLSALNQAGSAFLAGGLEFVVMRLPADGHEVSVFASVDHRGYLERGFSPETLAAIDLRYRRVWEDGWSLGGAAEYLFLKQVFDASEIEGVPAVVPTTGHTLTARPMVAREWSGGWRLELEAEAGRQWLAEPLDGYEDLGPKLALIRGFGERRSLGVSYRTRFRAFDERGPRDESGLELPGILRYQQHEAEMTWRHAWGRQGRWRTALRPGWVTSLDNGNGFFDYDRFQLAATVRWVGEEWEGRLDGRWRAYRFPGQPAGSGVDGERRRTDLNLTARADWKLVGWARLFLQYELDQSDENTEASDFRAHVCSLGIEVER